MDRRALTYRVLTAVVGIPLLLGAAWLGGWWWAAFVIVIFAIAAKEYAALHPSMKELDITSAMLGGFVALLSLFLADGREGQAAWVFGIAAVILYLGGILPPILTRNPENAGLLRYHAGVVVIGWTYVAVASAVIARWGFTGQFALILWILLIIWANDIAAYFVGHALGRRKLIPVISPGKSWEGSIAGIVAGAAASWILIRLVPLPPGLAVVAGGVVTVAAQLGDLFESAMKRRVGVKDSGVLLPGHGGVLDRFDGVFAAAPVAYLLLHWWAS